MRRLQDCFRTGRTILSRCRVVIAGAGICRTCRTAKISLNAERGHKRAMEAAGPQACRLPLLRNNHTDEFLMGNEGMFPSVFSMV